jgi:hypothetical protein
MKVWVEWLRMKSMICLLVAFSVFGLSVTPALSDTHVVSPYRLVTPSPVPTPPPTYAELIFTITTGGDDLRGDSSAAALIGGPAGSFQCLLKPNRGDGWDNNTVHTVPCPLPAPRTIHDLRRSSVTIAIDQNPGVVTLSKRFETDDNWNINRVIISAYTPGSGKSPVCLFDVTGNPFARLTGSDPGVIVTNFPSHC